MTCQLGEKQVCVDMRQVLIICPFFPPSAASGSYRMLGFARHLSKFDWIASVVACGPLPWEPNDELLAKSIPRGTDVRYVDFPLSKSRRFWPYVAQRFNWINGYHLWNAPALHHCEAMIGQRRPDVILTSGPPHTVHLVGRTLKLRHGIPWVADFRDPWCSWGNEKRYTGRPPVFSKGWERSIFAEADVIVANTSNTAKMFASIYPGSAERIVSVPNGYEPTEDSSDHPLSDPGLLTLLHTGVVYAGRDPRPLAKAVCSIGRSNLLMNRQPFLRLIGGCLNPQVTLEFASQKFAPWVRMEEHVPYHESQSAIRNADILVLLDTKNRRLGVPAKLYEYVGAKRPILALAEQDGDTAEVLRQSGTVHQVVSDWSPSTLEQAILSLSCQSIAPKAASGNGHVVVNFTRVAAAEMLAQRMDQLLHS